MKGCKFTEREEVAHIGNLSLKLFVKRLIWKTIKISTGNIIETADPNKPIFEKIKVRHFDGVVVTWWNGAQHCEEKFHSEQLVPWYVAEKGLEYAEDWLEEMKTKGQRNYNTPVKKTMNA